MGMSGSTCMMTATQSRALMKGWRRFLSPISGLLLVLGLSGCDVNRIPTLDEQTKAAWAQVENQYQRRADLIPNLVKTVQGYAQQERHHRRHPAEQPHILMALPELLSGDPAQLQDLLLFLLGNYNALHWGLILNCF